MGKYLRRKPILDRDQGQALICSKLILLDKLNIKGCFCSAYSSVFDFSWEGFIFTNSERVTTRKPRRLSSGKIFPKETAVRSPRAPTSCSTITEPGLTFHST